jgi:hypothetical protein
MSNKAPEDFTDLLCDLAMTMADVIDHKQTPDGLRDVLCGIADELTNALGPSVSELLRAVASVAKSRVAETGPAIEKRNGVKPRESLMALNADSHALAKAIVN